MSHTAGPWDYQIHAHCDPTGEYYHSIEITGEDGASTILVMDGDCDDAEDNARLVAASLDLLISCQMTDNHTNDSVSSRDHYAMLRQHGWDGTSNPFEFEDEFRRKAIASALPPKGEQP
jgi:hypothetical protein